MAAPSVVPSVTTLSLWRAARVLGVVALSAVLAGLLTWPDPTLAIVWNVVVPLVPASLLVSPALWRNVCPLATVHMALNSPAGRRLTPRLLRFSGTGAVVILFLAVPARRVLFNTDGTALAGFLALILMAAVGLGAAFDMKAGFCNALCPLLPVERLYGHRPLVQLGNPRCLPCTLCTLQGCIDLSPSKSVAQVLGRSRRSGDWLGTRFGLFAAAFPGFVVGYYTTANAPLADAWRVYLHVFGWAAGSLLLTAAVVRAFRLDAARTLPVLGGLAALLYYWFAAPLMADTLGVAPVGTQMIRVAAAALVGLWFVHGGRT